MKRLITMCLSALLAVGAVFGAPATKRAPAQNPSRPEGKPIVVNPKAAVSMRPVRGSLGIEAGTAGRQRITTGMSLPKAPERIGASGSTVYGNLVYDAGWNYPNSITEMFSDGRITSLIEPPQGSMGGDVQIVVIYVREGKMHCSHRRLSGGRPFWATMSSSTTSKQASLYRAISTANRK